jgi:hypothetical protein
MTMGTRPYSRCGERLDGWDGGCWYGEEGKNARGGAASESRRGVAGGRTTELGLGLWEEAGSGVAPAVRWARARAKEGVMAAAVSSCWGGIQGICGDGRGVGTDGEGRLI